MKTDYDYSVNTETAQLSTKHDYFGEMFFSFGKRAEEIMRARYMPFNSDGIRHIKDQISIIQDARAEVHIHLPYDKTVTINNVEYDGISFEVRMFHDNSQLSIVTRGKRKGSWNDGLTEAARKKLSTELHEMIFETFDVMAETLRAFEITRFKARSYAQLKDAQNNIEKTLQFLQIQDASEAA